MCIKRKKYFFPLSLFFVLLFCFFIEHSFAQNTTVLSYGDSVMNQIIKKESPIRWVSLADFKELYGDGDQKRMLSEYKQIITENGVHLSKLRSCIKVDPTFDFVYGSENELLYHVYNGNTISAVLLSIIRKSNKDITLVSLEADSVKAGLSNFQMGLYFQKTFEKKTLTIFHFQKAIREGVDIFSKRIIYDYLAFTASLDGYKDDAIIIYKKLAETDSDTLLIAAKAYRSIANLYNDYLHPDTVMRDIALDLQLHYINKSIEKYPNNIDAYIDKLNFYKYDQLIKDKVSFLQMLEKRFENNWRINFAIAEYYIRYDFPYKESPDFEFCMKYLKKTIELNPNHFDSYLYIASTFKLNEEERFRFIQKMYTIAPHQFIISSEKLDIPFRIQTLGKNASIGLSKLEAKRIKLL